MFLIFCYSSIVGAFHDSTRCWLIAPSNAPSVSDSSQFSRFDTSLPNSHALTQAHKEGRWSMNCLDWINWRSCSWMKGRWTVWRIYVLNTSAISNLKWENLWRIFWARSCSFPPRNGHANRINFIKRFLISIPAPSCARYCSCCESGSSFVSSCQTQLQLHILSCQPHRGPRPS